MTSSIGNTASITLLTGIPGSGKTARMVKFILDAIEAGELVYVCNVDGIKVPGVIPWEDPTAWRELPPGSLLVVDEAQGFFRARRSGDPPEYITAMETIRHDGVRLVLATQQPNYLDTHLRGLVGLHEHLQRDDGGKTTFIMRDNKVIENIRCNKKKAKELYDYESWKIDPKVFSYYTSAQVHTVMYTMPAKLKKAIVLAPIALAMFALPFVLIFRDGYSKATGGESPDQAAALAPQADGDRRPGARSSSGEQQPRTAVELAELLTPTIAGVAWSAPGWSGREVRSDPHVYCLASGHDGADGCTCFTEQATRFTMDLDRCYELARWGEPYNPFKQPEPASASRSSTEPRTGAGRSPAVEGAPAPAVAAIGIGEPGQEPFAAGTFRP